MMTLKEIKLEKFNKEGVFFTPKKLAEYIKSELYRYAKDNQVDEVYDITCGEGSLLRVFDDNVKKYGSELNEEFLNECKDIANFTGEQCNILKEEAFENKLFSYQVFNYPFSIKDKNYNVVVFDNQMIEVKRNKDAYFLLSILNKLKENGIAVGLGYPGITYRESDKSFRKALILSRYLREIELIDDSNFEDTKISVIKMVFVKNKDNENIIFREGNKSKIVNIKDIIKEDFNLSVNNYLFEFEEEKIAKPMTVNELISFSIKCVKDEIKLTKHLLELDFIVGDSNEQEHYNNIAVYKNKLIKLIKDS